MGFYIGRKVFIIVCIITFGILLNSHRFHYAYLMAAFTLYGLYRARQFVRWGLQSKRGPSQTGNPAKKQFASAGALFILSAYLWVLPFYLPGLTLSGAVANGNLSQVRFLKTWGANVNATDKLGQTPLHKALNAEDKIQQISLYLLKKGAKPNVSDFSGNTPLHLAAYYGREEAAKALIEYGATIDPQNRFKRTPLMEAFLTRHFGLALFLIENHAALDTRDLQGMTPRKWAEKNAPTYIFKLMSRKNN